MPEIKVDPILEVGANSLPSSECSQDHGATLIAVLPRGSRSTYIIDMDAE